MIKYLLDANVLLRFLRGDDAQHSPAARALFYFRTLAMENV